MNLNNNPYINLGTLGSVSDGKSTLIYQLTGVKTQKHSDEKHRNITIKAGYANLKIWECNNCNKLYSTNSDNFDYMCDKCNNSSNIVNHLSFVDCPGHQELIITMLSSISLMNGVIVVVSAAEKISQKPQLIQHLKALKLSKIGRIIICLNKLDLITKKKALERKEELDNLLSSLDIKPDIIIPTSFNKKIGLDNVLKYIMLLFSPNINKNNDIPFFRITRSFDINKSGINWDQVQGGVVGGSLISGNLKINDEIEIRPGIIEKNKTYKPIITKILSVKTDKIELDEIIPGGLVGIQTDIDPYYCKNDMLQGNIIGLVGFLPDVYTNIKINYTRCDDFDASWEPKENDNVFIQIGNISTEAKLINIKNMEFELNKPVCFNKDEMILVCKKDNKILKIVGFGLLNY